MDLDKTIINSSIAPLGNVNISKAEGNSGNTNFSFAIDRLGDFLPERTVEWSVIGSGDNPVDANDFVGGVLPKGVLTFAQNEVSKDFSFDVSGDNAFEPDETFEISISVPTINNITGTIVNDDLPILIVPGIVGSFVNSEDFAQWRQRRGLDPDDLVADPLLGTYNDLVRTLENTGYTLGQDLFVANYDWRLPPAPMDDGNRDGVITGISVENLTDNSYDYGIDYLGFWMQQASKQWKQRFPKAEPLQSINVIAHSTGGLVTRAYIQSDAYGKKVGDIQLPEINNFIMLGVPNDGAPKAWNPINDDWDADLSLAVALRLFINEPFEKLRNGELQQIDGPTLIDFSSITGKVETLNPFERILALSRKDSKEAFIDQYLPTFKALLATYDFGIEVPESQENTFLKDLNAGTGITKTLTRTENVSVLYGFGLNTITEVERQVGKLKGSKIQSFDDAFSRVPEENEIWWKDIISKNGDDTVPVRSAVLLPGKIVRGFEGVGHGKLPSDKDVQEQILEILGLQLKNGKNISTNLLRFEILAAKTILSFILDPVDGFLEDSKGRRLGYSQNTGAITEIPGSIWFGDENGVGWIFSDNEISVPLKLKLKGLGGDYYVEVSGLQNGKEVGFESQGFLAVGEELNFSVEAINNAPVLSNAIANQSATEDTAFIFTIPVNTFTDIDAGDVLTYSATLENGNALPTWLTFDPTARTFSGTPSNDNVGSLNIKVTATDSFGATANDSFTTIISNDMVGEPFWGLDIDGDGKVNALSDGIMVVRYMFGAAFSSNALINGAISPDATRDLAGIQTYLQEGVTKGYLDIDGDGKVNALSDGIMAVRYMFGAAFSGNALIDGAISPDATRDLAGIQTYLSGLTNPM